MQESMFSWPQLEALAMFVFGLSAVLHDVARRSRNAKRPESADEASERRGHNVTWDRRGPVSCGRR